MLKQLIYWPGVGFEFGTITVNVAFDIEGIRYANTVPLGSASFAFEPVHEKTNNLGSDQV